jgi:AraC-like DNA-binding protein
MQHSFHAEGDVELYSLLLDSEVTRSLPSECCTMTVSPLLRELIIEAAKLPPLYDVEGPSHSLIETMLNELTKASEEYLRLPMPTDPRLRKIADAFVTDPSDRATISDWAKRVGTSQRNLSRLVLRETGMTFGRWHQQFLILVALERMAKGEPVQTVGLDLGYESASAFITMFKKILGQPPGKYFATHQNNPSSMTAIFECSAERTNDGSMELLIGVRGAPILVHSEMVPVGSPDHDV